MAEAVNRATYPPPPPFYILYDQDLSVDFDRSTPPPPIDAPFAKFGAVQSVVDLAVRVVAV